VGGVEERRGGEETGLIHAEEETPIKTPLIGRLHGALGTREGWRAGVRAEGREKNDKFQARSSRDAEISQTL
jgi:hypothetical protein